METPVKLTIGVTNEVDKIVLKVDSDLSIILSPEEALLVAQAIEKRARGALIVNNPRDLEITVYRSVQVTSDLQSKLDMKISSLGLSVRSTNCLESAQILTVGDLVQQGALDLLCIRSFGKVSLRQVKQKLSELGLSLALSPITPIDVVAS